MADLSTSQIRNVAFVAHSGAGKTSLADALRVNGALTSVNLLRNELDAASAGTLADAAKTTSRARMGRETWSLACRFTACVSTRAP